MSASPIPIQNIYYLLSYAWNALDERDMVAADVNDCTELLELYGRVLAGGMEILLKRGLDRAYVPQVEETRSLRGKVLFGPTLKRNLLKQARVICEFDEFEHDILHNQILKASIRSLLRMGISDKRTRERLRAAYVHLQPISDIRLQANHFSQVMLHRNNAFYRFLLNICRLIHDAAMICDERGEYTFRDFCQDKGMPALFEQFMRHFYTVELPDLSVSAETIPWDVSDRDAPGFDALPGMRTDITLRSAEHMVIMDAKYYAEAITTSQHGKQLFKSANLYQLFAYLKNAEAKGGPAPTAAGVLVYPCVSHTLAHRYTIQGHDIHLRTLDLAQPWQTIHHQLLTILHTACPAMVPDFTTFTPPMSP